MKARSFGENKIQWRGCSRLPWVVTIQLRLAELASASQDCKFFHFDELLFRYQYPSVLEPVRLEIPIRIETIELRGTGSVPAGAMNSAFIYLILSYLRSIG